MLSHHSLKWSLETHQVKNVKKKKMPLTLVVLQSLLCSWLRSNWKTTLRKPFFWGGGGGEESEVGSELKGSGLPLANRWCDEITYFFVAMSTNLIPSNSLVEWHPLSPSHFFPFDHGKIRLFRMAHPRQAIWNHMGVSQEESWSTQDLMETNPDNLSTLELCPHEMVLLLLLT